MRSRNPAGFLRRGLGLALGGIVLNDVRLVDRGGDPRALKRRRWYAPLLILGGRLYIRLSGVRIRVVPEREWLAREIRFYRDLYGETAEVRDRWLDVPRRGEALALYLRRPELTPADIRRAVASASGELHRLHRLVVRDGSATRSFSHGDAGARNVAYDAASGRSHWFDFEMAHPPGGNRAWRQADDLRALLFSALALVPVSHRAGTAAALSAAYPDEEVRAALRERLAPGRLEADTYHLAQVRLGADEHESIRRLILHTFSETPAPRRNGGPACTP